MLALTALVTAAVACGGDDSSDADDTTAAVEDTEAPAETDATSDTSAEDTEAPAETDAPAETEAPDGTDAPAATEAPVETEAPAEELRGGSITLGAVAPPPSFDPAASMWGPLSAYYEAVYDTLLRLDASGEFQPWLATEWSYDDSRTVLTLTLRDDVTFTDGSALDAEVVAANLQRFKDGASGTAVKLAGVTSIETPDASTVVITLAQPDPNFLNAMAQEPGLIASGEALDDPDLATQPVGSGPYMLDSGATVIGATYAYTKNPDYWNPDAQYFDALEIRAGADPIAMSNAIRADEIDVTQLSNEIRPAADEQGWNVEIVSIGGFQGLMLFDRDGQLAEPLGDVRVRQAFNYAMDRPTLIEATDSLGSPSVQIFGENGVGHDPALEDLYPYDPERARELLAEAGYADGVTVTLPDLGSRDNFLFLAQQLAEVGITLDFEESVLENSITDILTAKYAVVYFALGGPTSWDTVQQVLSPDAAFNPFKNSDPELTALIEEMRLGDEDAAQGINTWIVENAWFAPLADSTSMVGTSPDVRLAAPTASTYPSIYDLRPA